jgi:serine/threonine protein kinase
MRPQALFQDETHDHTLLSAYQYSGIKTEGKKMFTVSEIGEMSRVFHSKGIYGVDPESLRYGGFALVASGHYRQEKVTFKITSAANKESLFADREFYLSLHSSRGMQIVPALVTSLSASSILSIKLFKSDGNVKQVYLLMMQTADCDFGDYYQLLKTGTQHVQGRRVSVRPCMQLQQVVRIVTQLVAAVHTKGFAHGDLNPSNILFIEVEQDYSIFGEAVVIFNGKRYKPILADGGGSIKQEVEYCRSMNDDSVRKKPPPTRGSAILAELVSKEAKKNPVIKLTAMSVLDAALSDVRRTIQTSGTPGWRLKEGESKDKSSIPSDPSKSWHDKLSPRELAIYKQQYFRYRKQGDIAALGHMSLKPLLNNKMLANEHGRLMYEGIIYKLSKTCKTADKFYEGIKGWILPPYRVHEGDKISDEQNIRDNLEFAMKCFNGTFVNAHQLLMSPFLTDLVYDRETELRLLSHEGLVCHAKLVPVPVRYQDEANPGFRMCAGSRLRLIKIGGKWCLSLSSYGPVNVGDLATIYGSVFREGRNDLCDDRHCVQVCVGAVGGGISLDGKLTVDFTLERAIDRRMLGSFINSVENGHANITSPEDGLWEPRTKHSSTLQWPEEYMQAFMFSKVHVGETEEVIWGWSYPWN